jgi:malate/lactate dehydrogenase
MSNKRDAAVRETLMLLDRVRRALPNKSNYALAKALGTSQSDLNKVLAGVHGLGLKSLVRASEITGVPLIDVIAITQEEIAKTPSNKAFWGQRSPRSSTTVAFAAVAFAVVGLMQDAHAVNIISKNLTTYTLCEWMACLGLLRF